MIEISVVVANLLCVAKQKYCLMYNKYKKSIIILALCLLIADMVLLLNVVIGLSTDESYSNFDCGINSF